MEELINALKIRAKWNNMPLNEFVNEYHKYYNVTEKETGFTREWMNDFHFSGLLNTDLIRNY